MIKKYQKGQICVRCGIEKSFAKEKQFYSCHPYWHSFEKHLWNTEELEVDVQTIKAN